VSAALGARCKTQLLALTMTRCLNKQGQRHGQGSSGRVQRWRNRDYHHDYGAGVKGAARLGLDGANRSDCFGKNRTANLTNIYCSARPLGEGRAENLFSYSMGPICPSPFNKPLVRLNSDTSRRLVSCGSYRVPVLARTSSRPASTVLPDRRGRWHPRNPLVR
jgi:hypothetical protein